MYYLLYYFIRIIDTIHNQITYKIFQQNQIIKMEFNYRIVLATMITLFACFTSTTVSTTFGTLAKRSTIGKPRTVQLKNHQRLFFGNFRQYTSEYSIIINLIINSLYYKNIHFKSKNIFCHSGVFV